MSDAVLPLIVEAQQLQAHLQDANILIVDLCQPDSYVRQHIPNAVFLDYAWIVAMQKPVMGLLPDSEQLSRVLGAYGISDDVHVVAYDDEGGGRAARFLWTLECAGHTRYSLLDGGLLAWANGGFALSNEIRFPQPATVTVSINPEPIADRAYILSRLNDENVVILDTRSPAEYNAMKVFAARGGHIPGAVNIEWTEAMDRNNNLQLKPQQQLQEMLAQQGITPDKTVVCHCQSHHRSAHTYIMLKSLGYTNIKGYPGSWSDWGNAPDTPIE